MIFYLLASLLIEEARRAERHVAIFAVFVDGLTLPSLDAEGKSRSHE
jgi:hypothetical protein